MIKRGVSLCLAAIAILVMCLSFNVAANNNSSLKFKVTTSEISNGKVTATVSIEENPGLISYVVALKYDNTKFKAVYNSENNSAVVDKGLFGVSMDSITSNSDSKGADYVASLDYVTAVAVSNGYNANLTTTGDVFSDSFPF